MSDFSLEKKLTHLRQLIDRMQRGVGDFDQQLALFQEGQQVVQACRQYLDEAELQVQQLLDGEVQDFEPGDQD